MSPLLAFCLTGQLTAASIAASQMDAAQTRAVRSQTDEVAELKEAVASLRRQLDIQQELLAQHTWELATERRALESLRRQVSGTTGPRPTLVPIGTVAPPPMRLPSSAMDGVVATTDLGRSANLSSAPVKPPTAATTAAEPGGALQQQTGARPPELPQTFVAKGEFPGSIEIPGTDAAFRIGGEARASLVHSFGPLGVDDRFITSSIPVDMVRAGDDARVTYTAGPSRANLEFRSPSSFGGFRSFMEYDFMGSGNTARMRHAFIQANRWIFGQTWSTFSDPEAQPADIDYEGLNAISHFRQAQVRYTLPLRSRVSLAFALENPAPDLTGATGVNLTPDFIARLRWDPASPQPELINRIAHLQAAVLVRTLRGDLADRTDTTLSTGGFGVNVSGVVLPNWDRAGRIKFATNNGWGIGRYIKDLEALGGQDAVYDPSSAELRALGVASGYIGYERQWRPRWQTSTTFGVVSVSNLDIQPDDALKRTLRGTVSVTWTPVERADLVAEFLAGERVNKNGHHGSSTQFQAGWKIRF